MADATSIFNCPHCGTSVTSSVPGNVGCNAPKCHYKFRIFGKHDQAEARTFFLLQPSMSLKFLNQNDDGRWIVAYRSQANPMIAKNLCDLIDADALQTIQIGLSQRLKRPMTIIVHYQTKPTQAEVLPIEWIETENGLFGRINPEGRNIYYCSRCENIREYHAGEMECFRYDCQVAYSLMVNEAPKAFWQPCWSGLVDIALPVVINHFVAAVFFTGQIRWQDAKGDLELVEGSRSAAKIVPIAAERLIELANDKDQHCESSERLDEILHQFEEVVDTISVIADNRYWAERSAREAEFQAEVFSSFAVVEGEEELWLILSMVLQRLSEFCFIRYAVFLVQEGDSFRPRAMAGITQETAGSFTLSELEIAQVFEQGTLYPVRTSDRVHHQAVYEKITDFLGVIDVNCAFLSPCEMKVGRALILLADRKKVRPERRKTGLVSEHCHDFLTRITHQIKNEVQNELNICQLRKAITEKDELMATTGHILVAPLSKAHGKVQGLRELISEHSVEAIAEESDIINFLCNSLCEDIVRCSGLSRSFRFLTTLGKQSEFYRFDKDVSLLELVNKCVEDFRYLAADRSIRFDVATSGFVSKVRLDGDKLEIALGNLLDNAIKYSDVGRTVIIRISQDRSDVLLTISNFGVGIPQEEWELVFERYYRSKIHDPNRFIPGTGIGLTVVKEIITKQGGLIDVTSKQGPSSIGGSSSVKGFNTTFHIRLPRKGRRT